MQPIVATLELSQEECLIVEAIDWKAWEEKPTAVGTGATNDRGYRMVIAAVAQNVLEIPGVVSVFFRKSVWMRE